MRFNDSSSREDRRGPGISCLSCRRRKVKCDRRFPQCRVCEQTSQLCNYPSGALKPGPKIGSIQRQRKRNRENETERSGGDDDDDGDGTHRPSTRRRLDHLAQNSLGDAGSPEDIGTPSPLAEDTTQDKPASTSRILDLSFVLHPSHETSSPENNERNSDVRQTSGDTQQHIAIDRACSALGLRQNILQQLVKTYFDNMVAINLFHEPSFAEKLSKIASPTQLSALLAAMLTFAVRFYSDDENSDIRQCEHATTHQRAARFLDMALMYIDEALKECGDSTPPLCILQASIIASHCQLTQGVLGRAWRSLGTCVRLAYEMNLHLVDVRGGSRHATAATDADKWCEDEEKRRAWWAIWEMDVFATTIRRTPPAVDWAQIETLLPVEDECWFQRRPRPSCFLERDPVSRWEALENSGNQSPKAWFIVINSLMKDAQRISSPRGIPNLSPTSESQPDPSSDSRNCRRASGKTDEARQKLETIDNAVHCFRMALPSHLKYQNQYLGFDARAPGQYSSLRQTHCSIYNIYMMTQLARLMIYRYDVFKGSYRVALSTRDSPDRRSVTNQDRSHQQQVENGNLAINQYFEAADDMLAIVHRSCDDHVRYINPFLSNTIWLASAVQLLRIRSCRPGTNESVVKSRFKVMHLTYKKCVSFWDMHTAVQQNFQSLEEQLEPRQRSGSRYGPESSTDGHESSRARPASNDQVTGNHARDDMPESTNSRARLSHTSGADHASLRSYLPNNADDGSASQQDSQQDRFLPSPPSSHGLYNPTDWQATKTPGEAAATRTPNTSSSMLDFMSLPSQVDTNPDTRATLSNQNHITPSSATLIDPMLFFSTAPQQSQELAFLENNIPRTSDIEHGVDWNWTYPKLPSDFQDMLSGLFTS